MRLPYDSMDGTYDKGDYMNFMQVPIAPMLSTQLRGQNVNDFSNEVM